MEPSHNSVGKNPGRVILLVEEKIKEAFKCVFLSAGGSGSVLYLLKRYYS